MLRCARLARNGFEGSLEVCFEREGLPRFDLPPALATTYGGGIGFSVPRVIANFVASTDGVVALDGTEESGHVISMDNSADRFVMGLLRACASAVVVGAGTLRRSPSHRWVPETIYPACAPLFAETRRRLGLAPSPRFVLLTASGAIETKCPALEGAIVATTPVGAAALRGKLPASAEVFVPGAILGLAAVLARLREDGAHTILTEGGPMVMSQFVAEGVLDELFLTLSPALLGRAPNDRRKALTDGLDLGRIPLQLESVRRAESHLFLRYSIQRPAPSLVA